LLNDRGERHRRRRPKGRPLNRRERPRRWHARILRRARRGRVHRLPLDGRHRNLARCRRRRDHRPLHRRLQ
jgi:hypothetical protein